MLLHRLLNGHLCIVILMLVQKAGEWLFDGPFEMVTNGIEL